MDEWLSGSQQVEYLKEMFKQVLERNEKMAKGMAQDLVPIREELRTLDETIVSTLDETIVYWLLMKLS